MSASGLTIEQEMKTVALLARGDTHVSIAKVIGIGVKTVSKVRKRNAENLQIIKEKMLVNAAETAEEIKNQANAKLKSRLDREDRIREIINKAHEQYLNEEITHKELSEILRTTKELSINELVSVSKAMHDQSVHEEKPPATQSDLAALAAAIRSGDEIKITQAVFNGNSRSDAP